MEGGLEEAEAQRQLEVSLKVLQALNTAGCKHVPKLCETVVRIVGRDGFPCLPLTPVCRHFTPCTFKFTRAYALQLLHVLACAHRLGFIHRDIRPTNIMWSSSQCGLGVVLLDWGLAVNVSDARHSISGSLRVPVIATFAGTVQCASPSIIRSMEAGDGSYHPSPSDDLHSWVRACYLLSTPGAEEDLRMAAGHEALSNLPCVTQFWKNVWERNSAWAALETAARAGVAAASDAYRLLRLEELARAVMRG